MWRHVREQCNPADLPSTGCTLKILLDSRCWEGPQWLRLPAKDWQNFGIQINKEEVSKEKRKGVSSVNISSSETVWSSYSLDKSSAMNNFIANEKNSNMQPDLRMHVCKHSICFLQHQVCSVCNKKNTIGYKWLKAVFAKQHFIVKHDLVGQGLNPGESMDVCKCIVPLWHWGTLNSHRYTSPLVRLMEGEERWEAFNHHWMFSLKIELEPSQIVLSPA
ncbi:hypothetical protein TNCV_4151861 [Trichonephila clavipes]|nr:hypothetical protein TNCV_4151861 [Trichonephila clavipes]